MNVQSILKVLIKDSDMNYKDIGRRMGGITAQGISGQLNRQHSISVSKLINYLDILGYELAIRAKGEKTDIFVITNSESNRGDMV